MPRKRSTGEGQNDRARFIERDLTSLAKEGKLERAYGVEAEVSEVLGLLERGRKAPLLVGEAGVGKTAIVQEVARAMVSTRPVQGLSRLIEISIAGVIARADNERRGAEALEGLLEFLGEEEGTVIFVRDLPLAQGNSLQPVLLAALRGSRLRFIFEGHPLQTEELLRQDEVLAEQTHRLVISEPSVERGRWILGQVAAELENELQVPIDPAACDMVLRLSCKFLLSKRLPRKAVELLRESAAEAVNSGKDRLSAEDVLRRLCSTTRLPRSIVDDDIALDLAETERFLLERILDQNEAVAAVLRSVALLKAGLNDPRRPLGVFLFVGPTGVGKTHLAKLLAEYLFGSADRLIRLNMADYAKEGDETTIFGQQWADTYPARRGELTRLLDGKVFAVLLLDEFEKAIPACHDRFLQLFDEGQFINAAGETIACGNTLIIATSNLGAEVYREPPLGFSGVRSPGELTSEVDKRVAQGLRAELLNRFDAICHFLPLGKVAIRRIAQREVGRVLEREGIRARGLDVEVAPEVIDILVERGYSPVFGARFLQRQIEKTLTTSLAIEIVKRALPVGGRIRVVAKKGGQVVAVAEESPSVEATARLALPAASAVKRRRLDRKELIAEAERLISRAEAATKAAGREGLDARKAELLTATQAPNFWDQPERAAETLRTFRQVEAQLTDLERLRKLCQFARNMAGAAKTEPKLVSAARAVEEAAREVQLAEARLAAGAKEIDEALLEICASSDNEVGAPWVRELVQMYQGWSRRRGYEESLVAEGQKPTRVVMRISGPGVLGFLSGELGLHRRIENGIRVGAFVRLYAPKTDPDHLVEVEGTEVRRRPGTFVERIASEVRARDESTGRAFELKGSVSPEELRQIAALVMSGQGVGGEEVRRYFVGRGARVEDLRTGAGTPRLKEVLRGELDLFIAAWMSRISPSS